MVKVDQGLVHIKVDQGPDTLDIKVDQDLAHIKVDQVHIKVDQGPATLGIKVDQGMVSLELPTVENIFGHMMFIHAISCL